MINSNKNRRERSNPYMRPSQVDKKSDEDGIMSYVSGFFSRLKSLLGTNQEASRNATYTNDADGLTADERRQQRENIDELSSVPPFEPEQPISFPSPELAANSLYPTASTVSLPSPNSDPQIQLILQQKEEVNKLRQTVEQLRQELQAHKEQKAPINPQAARPVSVTSTDVVRKFLRGKTNKRRTEPSELKSSEPAPDSAFSFTNPRPIRAPTVAPERMQSLNASYSQINESPSRHATPKSSLEKRKYSNIDGSDQDELSFQSPINTGTAVVSEHHPAKRVRGHFSKTTIEQNTPKNYSETAKRIMEKLDMLTTPLSLKKTTLKKYSVTPRPARKPRPRSPPKEIVSISLDESTEGDGFSPPPPTTSMGDFLPNFAEVAATTVREKNLQKPTSDGDAEKQNVIDVNKKRLASNYSEENEESLQRREQDAFPEYVPHKKVKTSQLAQSSKKPSTHNKSRFNPTAISKPTDEVPSETFEERIAPLTNTLSAIGGAPIVESSITFPPQSESFAFLSSAKEQEIQEASKESPAKVFEAAFEGSTFESIAFRPFSFGSDNEDTTVSNHIDTAWNSNAFFGAANNEENISEEEDISKTTSTAFAFSGTFSTVTFDNKPSTDENKPLSKPESPVNAPAAIEDKEKELAIEDKEKGLAIEDKEQPAFSTVFDAKNGFTFGGQEVSNGSVFDTKETSGGFKFGGTDTNEKQPEWPLSFGGFAQKDEEKQDNESKPANTFAFAFGNTSTFSAPTKNFDKESTSFTFGGSSSSENRNASDFTFGTSESSKTSESTDHPFNFVSSSTTKDDKTFGATENIPSLGAIESNKQEDKKQHEVADKQNEFKAEGFVFGSSTKEDKLNNFTFTSPTFGVATQDSSSDFKGFEKSDVAATTQPLSTGGFTFSGSNGPTVNITSGILTFGSTGPEKSTSESTAQVFNLAFSGSGKKDDVALAHSEPGKALKTDLFSTSSKDNTALQAFASTIEPKASLAVGTNEQKPSSSIIPFSVGLPPTNLFNFGSSGQVTPSFSANATNTAIPAPVISSTFGNSPNPFLSNNLTFSFGTPSTFGQNGTPSSNSMGDDAPMGVDESSNGGADNAAHSFGNVFGTSSIPSFSANFPPSNAFPASVTPVPSFNAFPFGSTNQSANMPNSMSNKPSQQQQHGGEESRRVVKARRKK